jgi:predicted aldo/keto reductase-like oxidoreductase
VGSRDPSNRRTFLKRAGAYSGLLGVGSILKYDTQLFLLRKAPAHDGPPRTEWAGATVKEYRTLGRTGWKMSDISFGSSSLTDPSVLRLALDRGVNYVDTSPDYSDSQSEKAVGQAIKGRRDKVFVASKFCTPKGHLDENTPVPEIIKAVEDILGRLETDYVDLLHIHACNSVDRLMAPTFHEAFDRLKEQGKARFMGVSSHTPELEAVFSKAVDSGRFDVIMSAYNFANWPKLDEIMTRAKEKSVGVVAMKTLKGAYHTVLGEFTPDERNSFAQAAFKWVNTNPNVSGLVVTISRPAQVDEYLFASGKRANPADLALLEKYDRLVSAQYCRPGCGECLEACPADLPINDVLRYSMYFDTYGTERQAMKKYAKVVDALGHGAEVCASCTAPCEAQCPYDIPIKEKLGRADRLLRLDT